MPFEHLQNSFKSVEAVIFDLDGTLYDFKGLPRRLVLNAPFQMFKIRAEREARKSLKGRDLKNKAEWQQKFFELIAQFAKIPFEKAKNWYKDFYCPYMVKILRKYYSVRPEALEIFKNLKKANIKIVVFSDYPLIKERLNAIGVNTEDFDYLVSAEDFGALKPTPRPFLEIAEYLKVMPENVLVVGDRMNTDGKGAKDAKMQFLHTESHKTPANDSTISWKDFLEIVKRVIA